MYRNMRSVIQVSGIFRPLKPTDSYYKVVPNLSRLYTHKGGKDTSGSRSPKSEECVKKTFRSPTQKTDHGPCPRSAAEMSCSDYSRRGPPGESDCGKSNVMKEMPQPDCPWDGSQKNKKYQRHLLIGLLFTAISCYAFYKWGLNTDKESAPRPKEVKAKRKRKQKVIIKNPADSKDIPNNVPYLLIGGGTASFSAFRSIKSLDPTAKVLVISNESYFPYMRPPLSKEVWFNESVQTKDQLVFKQWNGTERSIFYEPNDFYVDCKALMSQQNGGVAVARGWNVKKLDVFGRKAYLEDGYEINYDKCLIATGSTPKNLPVFEEASIGVQDKITLYRDVFDYQELDEVITEGVKNIVIIGGGFLGSELACALARRGKTGGFNVTQIFRESGNMGKVLPDYLSFWTSNKVKNEGVEVMPNCEVDDTSLERDRVVLHLSTGEKVRAEQVIVAVGAEPNTELAEPSQLELDEEFGGFTVNAELMARSHLWIAGDCTCFYDTKLGRRRVEHHDHAVVSGRLAGENMTGAGKPYYHQSMFWSDLGPEVGYEAIGIVDSSLPTVGVFAKATDKDTPKAVVTATDEGNRAQTEADAKPVTPASSSPSPPKEGEDYGKGVIFYLRDDIVVGIVLWNVFNRMSVARQVLKDERRYEDLNEVAKLFNIHEE